MPHKVTPETQEIVFELRRLAASVAPYLGVATPGARREWEAMQALWPSDADLGQCTMAVSLDELDGMRAKVRRFGEILRNLERSLGDAIQRARV
jgi:hypothetical protein